MKVSQRIEKTGSLDDIANFRGVELAGVDCDGSLVEIDRNVVPRLALDVGDRPLYRDVVIVASFDAMHVRGRGQGRWSARTDPSTRACDGRDGKKT